MNAAGADAARVAVVGVGLNLLAQRVAGHSQGYSQDYSQGYASLEEMDGGMTPPQVLARVAAPLLRALLRFQADGFAPLVAAYARRDVLRGRAVSTTQPGLPEAVAQGVDPRGALCVRQGGLHRVVSGEVSVRPRPLATLDAREARDAT